MRPNRLQLNTAKTEVLWSTSSRRLRLLPVSPIRCPQLRRLHYADVSMRSHVSKTVTAFLRFCVNCGVFVGNRRSVPRSVLQSLVSSLVLQRLDYGNAILADIPSHPTKRRKRMQSVLKSAARLVFSASRYDRMPHHVTPDRVAQCTGQFKLAVLVYRCLHQTAPPYLAEELHQSSADEARQRLRSASTSSLVVPCTHLSFNHRRSSFSGRCCPTVEHCR